MGWAFSKSGYRFCVRMRLKSERERCAHASSFVPAPETRPFMPRDNDKNNDSRGRRDRPSGGKGRSGVASGPEKKFAKRGFAGKGGGRTAPVRRQPGRSPPRRDDRDAPRAARATARLRIGRREAVTVRSVRSGRVRIAAATSVRTRRAEIGRSIVATAATRVRPRASRTGNSATRNLTRRARIARNGPTRRAARAFARTATARAVTARSRAAAGWRPAAWRPAVRRSSREKI